jgi:uncharacterized lipoprotein (TIGR02269 family)
MSLTASRSLCPPSKSSARFFPHCFWLSQFLFALVQVACTTPSATMLAREETEQDDPAACSNPGADQCVVFACDEGLCGVFACEDVDSEAMSRAPTEHGAELARGSRPPFRSPSTHRNWRRTGLRDGARPRLTFHFEYRHGFLPAFPRLEGRLIKHHLFPQEARLAAWFRAQGINIHEWTMVIPEHVHLRIHRGARGGLWNEAWRQYVEANAARRVPREELLAKAFELAFRYDIVGPIRPYSAPIPPPGPQLIAP